MPDITLNSLTSDERAHLERVDGVILDIQRYSVHDGPGLRTNVFLKDVRCVTAGAPTRNHKTYNQNWPYLRKTV